MFKHFSLLLFIPLIFKTGLFAQPNVWLNEIHYDNGGLDVDEMLEIVLENAGTYNLGDFEIFLYNFVGSVYNNLPLFAFTASTPVNNFTLFTYTFPMESIQNGPAGIAISYQGGLIPGQFLSYEGVLFGTSGPAGGYLSTDIGAQETGSEPPGFSLQLLGSGTQYSDFTWLPFPVPATPGLPNSDGAGGDQTLPIELTSFTVSAGDGYVTLNWTTASESDNLGYAILRGLTNEGTYEELDSYVNNNTLKGAGNSSSSRNYKYVDNSVMNGITYWYKLVDVDINGIRTEHGPTHATPRADDIQIDPVDGNIPLIFDLFQNFPNPFNPSTTISFDIPELKDGFMNARVIIYDMLGQKIKTLLKSTVEAGHFELEWDGTNELNQLVPSGVYIYQFQSDLFYASKKMVLMR